MRKRSDREKIYGSWARMHTRCYDGNYHSWHRYGGRGIIVCDAWQEFKNFYADMHEAWFQGATVDRIDNDGNYCPENCRWATKAENTKPLKYDIQEMLELYEGGMTQREVGTYYGLTQDRVSKLLKRARNVQKT